VVSATGASLRADRNDQEVCGHDTPLALRGGRLDSIQVLRAVAAIGVVFTHAITRLSTSFPGASEHALFTGLGGQLTVGDAGVDLFFVISGFIMLHVHRNDFGRPGAPLRFMLRRILRIVPIYWLLTTLALVFLIFAPQLFTTHYRGIYLPWIVGSYLFLPIAPPDWNATPVVGVGWTLNYEMFFYAVFAGALLLPRRLGLQLIFVCFGILVGLGILWKLSAVRFPDGYRDRLVVAVEREIVATADMRLDLARYRLPCGDDRLAAARGGTSAVPVVGDSGGACGFWDEQREHTSGKIWRADVCSRRCVLFDLSLSVLCAASMGARDARCRR